MRYQRTQVYLQPEAHRLLSEEAKDRGLSLTGLLREIVTLHVRERVEAYRPRGLEALIGLDETGDSTNVAREQDDYLRIALEERLEKKLGRSPGRGPRARNSRRKGRPT